MTLGLVAAHFRIPQTTWLHLHLTFLLMSLYILVGGGVNEVFLRVHMLRLLAPTLNSPAVGLTHFGVIVVFLALIGYFNAMVLRRSRTRRQAPLDESAESLDEQPVVSTALSRALR
jgi:hypothetical protein